MAKSNRIPELGINLDGVLLPLSQSLSLFNRELGIVAEGVAQLGRALTKGNLSSSLSSAVSALGLFKTAAERAASALPGSASALSKPFEILSATIGVAVMPAFAMLGAATLTVAGKLGVYLKENTDKIAKAYADFVPVVVKATTAVTDFTKAAIQFAKDLPQKAEEAHGAGVDVTTGFLMKSLSIDSPLMKLANQFNQWNQKQVEKVPVVGDFFREAGNAIDRGFDNALDAMAVGPGQIGQKLFGIEPAGGVGGDKGKGAKANPEDTEEFLKNWKKIIDDMVFNIGGKGGMTDILGARRGLQQAAFMSPFEMKLLELTQEQIRIQRKAIDMARENAAVGN